MANPISFVSVSTIVLTKNEEQNIARCLKALTWCDDVVVVDDGSDDKTRSIAESLGARVVEHPFESFAAQRNWALKNAQPKHGWVLLLDADEVCTTEFSTAVTNAIRTEGDAHIAFALCRKTMLFGRWLKYSDGFPVWIMRLVKKGQVEFQDSGHGEVPIPELCGTIGYISEPFLHYSFSKGIASWIEKHNRYSTREANMEVEEQRPVSFSQLFSLSSSARRNAIRNLARKTPGRAFFRFIYQYLFKLGFLDGRAGLTFCLLMACYELFIDTKKKEILTQRER